MKACGPISAKFTPFESQSECAVTRIGYIDAARLAGRYHLESDSLRLDISFIAHVVRVVTPGVDKCHPCRVDIRLALRIIAFVIRHRPGRDDDQAMSGMRVPAGAPPGAQTLFCT